MLCWTQLFADSLVRQVQLAVALTRQVICYSGCNEIQNPDDCCGRAKLNYSDVSFRNMHICPPRVELSKTLDYSKLHQSISATRAWCAKNRRKLGCSMAREEPTLSG